MIIFLAGTEGQSFAQNAVRGGGTSLLNSFYSLGCGKKPPVAKDMAKNYVLDSGGYSARVHGIDIDVKKYAEYLNKYKIPFAFNLDVLDLDESLKNFYYLNHATKTYIMPVYHGPEWKNPKTRDLLDYYIDCFPFMALGGIAGKEISEENTRRFLDYVFKRTGLKTMVHGLGTTRVPLLKRYPFFCVDSTSWLMPGKFGTSNVYSDDMCKVRNKNIAYDQRLTDEVAYWTKLEKEITTLWKKRGVVWADLDYNDLMKKRKLLTYTEWKEQNGR